MNGRNPSKAEIADLDAEAAVLGTLLQNPTLWREFALSDNYFSDERHVAIFRVMTRLAKADERIDLARIAHELRVDLLFKQAGGIRFLEALRGRALGVEQARARCAQLSGLMYNRELHSVLLTSADAIRDGMSADELVPHLVQLFTSLVPAPSAAPAKRPRRSVQVPWKQTEREHPGYEWWEADFGTHQATVYPCDHGWEGPVQAPRCWSLCFTVGPLHWRVECHPSVEDLKRLVALCTQGFDPKTTGAFRQEIEERARFRKRQEEAEAAAQKAEYQRQDERLRQNAVSRLVALTGHPAEKLVDAQGRVRYYLHGDQAEHDAKLFYSSRAKKFLPREGFAHDDADITRLRGQLPSRWVPAWGYRPEEPPNLFFEKATTWRARRYFDERTQRWSLRYEPPDSALDPTRS